MTNGFRNGLIALFLLVFAEVAMGQNSPGVKKIRHLIIYENPSFYSTFPSVIKRPDGEIMVAFRRAPDRKIFGEKSTNHVDPNSYLVYVQSQDNAVSWSKEPELLYAHPYGGSQDPCLLQLKDGSILCTSYGWAFIREGAKENMKKPVFEAAQNVVFLGGYVLRSEDRGGTWQGPFYPPNVPQEQLNSATRIPIPAYNRGALVEGKNGQVYWVVAARTDPENPTKTSAHLLTSHDQGKTWNYSSKVAEDKEASFNETSIYETPKGDLVAFLRTSGMNDAACIARSTDGGKTFEPWKDMGFQGHPMQALRLPDDRVLIVYGYRHEPYGIRGRILNAECTDYETAEEIIIRADGGSTDIGYPWAVLLDEKQVLVTYYFNLEKGTRHIAGSILEISPAD